MYLIGLQEGVYSTMAVTKLLTVFKTHDTATDAIDAHKHPKRILTKRYRLPEPQY